MIFSVIVFDVCIYWSVKVTVYCDVSDMAAGMAPKDPNGNKMNTAEWEVSF